MLSDAGREWQALINKMVLDRQFKQSNCNHEFEMLDAGPFSDDIYYVVCKHCDAEKD